MVAWSSACSHHLYLPCFSDRFCRCPWALLLPLPPEWASLEFGITFVAPPWLRCSKEPRDTMSWCASHCWLQTSQDAKTDVEKHPNIIPKRSRVADKGCSTKSLISTPNFWAGKIPFKCFSAMLGTKSWKELLAQATTGDFGKMDWGGRGRRETTSSAPRGGRQPAQTLRCQQRPPWERPPSLGVPCLKMAPSASPPHRAGAAAPTRVWRRRYRPPPQLRPPLQGAGRGSRGCSLGSWCLRPFRLEDEAAGGRTFAGGAFLRRLLPARLGACQLLWGGRGERGLQGENSHGRARHGRSPPSPRKHREGLARLGVSAARGGGPPSIPPLRCVRAPAVLPQAATFAQGSQPPPPAPFALVHPVSFWFLGVFLRWKPLPFPLNFPLSAGRVLRRRSVPCCSLLWRRRRRRGRAALAWPSSAAAVGACQKSVVTLPREGELRNFNSSCQLAMRFLSLALSFLQVCIFTLFFPHGLPRFSH